VGLAFWCIASFAVVDALAASLEPIEFDGASQPLVGDAADNASIRMQQFLDRHLN